ncbi:hypothetical protein OGZ02_15180 [Brachyspira hyodysenteriae]|nr:hypothetical protein [Brachyspira hyodysenteriae]
MGYSELLIATGGGKNQADFIKRINNEALRMKDLSYRYAYIKQNRG